MGRRRWRAIRDSLPVSSAAGHSHPFSGMKIELLADHPEYVEPVARWHHGEWAYLRPGDTLEKRLVRLRADCGRQVIPITCVATEGGAVLGSAMLIAHDMDTHMEWTPWLAGVFVAQEKRGTGIGAALVRHAMRAAADLGIAVLYLYTPKAELFYTRLGWTVLERTFYRGTDVTVMSAAVAR
jgi:GNAT superfamily N-acetyltransferase